MEQKYRTLDVGEMLQVGDEYFALSLDRWNPVRNLYRVDYADSYRRPITETHIHGSGTYVVDSAPTEETITEVREAWLKDHMEMKRKLDAAVAERMDIERMWFGQRAELADARNQITDLQRELKDAKHRVTLNEQCKFVTDLTRRLEDAMSEKVIAEKSYHEARVERDQAVKDLGGTTTMLMKANSENHDLKINLDNAMRSMVSDEAKFTVKNATICRLKEKLKNLEHHVENEHVASWRKIQQVLPEFVRNLDLPLVDQVVKCITDLSMVDNAAQNWQDIKVSKNGETHTLGTLIPLLESQIASMEARISKHHKEADRLTRQNEELSKASYQLNTIKQAFQFIKES